MRTTGCWPKTTPATAVAEGWVGMVSLGAEPALTVKTPLTALTKPLALAVSWSLVPAASSRRLVKLAVPLPAAVPMSRLVAPCKAPAPLVRLTFTFRLAGKPTAELFPKASWLLTTGWVPKTDPAVALPGCVVKASRLAGAGLMAIVVEVALVPGMPGLLNRIVMLVATLCDKLVNVTSPLTAVRLGVPCKFPLPSLRLAVTTVLLSALPLAALRQLPN